MKLYLKFDASIAFKQIMKEQLEAMKIHYSHLGVNEVDIEHHLTGADIQQMGESLGKYGIEIIEKQKSILVQKIKDAIIEMVNMDEKLPVSNSAWLSEKLKHRYAYLSSVFSEVTYTSIENFILLQKTERAKHLISTNEYTFTEIAYMLNYSSVAYFSNQFKSMTGITPTAFQRIINKKRELSSTTNS